DRLTELDGVNAQNARDIQDVDGRAQAGIRQAQSTADAAGKAAGAANTQAKQAAETAQGASARVDALDGTVAGLDQYRQTSEILVEFRSGQPVLSAAARQQLDELARGLAGRQGYLLEIEGHAPQAGNAGIENSGKLAEAVRRYLVTNHEIPVYRLRPVALGNAPSQPAGSDDARPAKTSLVRIRLMENSLAAREGASPHGAASVNGAERP
ncbi:MAG: OmpA family protein, partial [Terracidiphilus sp.]